MSWGKPKEEKDPVWWKGKWERKFLGKVKDFDSKEEQKQETAHLKAYIKGKTHYKWGYKEIKNPYTQMIEIVPNLIPVKQQLTKIN